ncbi:MAG: hypothetical protein IAE89_00180 [Anaerolineae bacterium]|nr:hypothetical protein [Anaerolineae bacterium]
MAEVNYSVERDLEEAQAMVDSLERYVRGNEIYGRAGSGGMFSMTQMPSLTLGALLMRLRRLQALRNTLTSEQQLQLDRMLTTNEDVHREWHEHYQAKLEREAISRLKAMSIFFEELRDNPKMATSSYQPEALRRTIAQVLHDEMKKLDLHVEHVENEMAAVDSRLRRWFSKGPFIWASALEAAYPADEYWWLYVQPKADRK